MFCQISFVRSVVRISAIGPDSSINVADTCGNRSLKSVQDTSTWSGVCSTGYDRITPTSAVLALSGRSSSTVSKPAGVTSKNCVLASKGARSRPLMEMGSKPRKKSSTVLEIRALSGCVSRRSVGKSSSAHAARSRMRISVSCRTSRGSTYKKVSAELLWCRFNVRFSNAEYHGSSQFNTKRSVPVRYQKSVTGTP